MMSVVSAPPPQARWTYYNLHWFRSQTEARWPVMLDSLDITWQHEVQFFHLPWRKYLPDFYLPDVLVASTRGLWMEIKGHVAGTEETRTCQQLVELTRKPMLFVKGAPGEIDGYLLFKQGELEPRPHYQFAMCDEGHLTVICPDIRGDYETIQYCMECDEMEIEVNIDDYRLKEAQMRAQEWHFDNDNHSAPQTLRRW